MTNTITRDSVHEIAASRNLRKIGSRYAGQCPKCGGSEQTDRFVLFADGGFKCFSCDFKGDRIKWLREMEGMSCKEAHDHEGMGCSPSCPHYASCRTGQPVARRPRSVAVSHAGSAKKVPTIQEKTPAQVWQDWADALMGKAKALLAHQPNQVAWLEQRGIPAWAIDRFGLGWMGHDMRVKRQDLGLPDDAGKEQLWIPGGLVIPTFDADGRIHRLRVRRTPESRARFLPERKYEWIRGSGNAPLCLGPRAGCRGVVVVEAELDALACAAAHQEVAVIALGTVAGGLTSWQHELCRMAPVILVCLDADSGRDGNMGAGPKSVQRWRDTFRQARFWPVPQGKDPGDYAKDHQGCLRSWIEAGLPPVVKQSLTATQPRQDAATFPDEHQRGEGGAEKEGCQEGVKSLLLDDGTEIWLTNNQEQWRQLTAQGLPVFSQNELERLGVALSGLDGEGRRRALASAVEAKMVFGGYIVRGRDGDLLGAEA